MNKKKIFHQFLDAMNFKVRKEPEEETWDVLITGSEEKRNLIRYVDEEYGVVIYVSDGGRITSQKL